MKIAVYAICKNERKHIEGFLENTREADYVVICDTGSTDHTIEGVFSWLRENKDDHTPRGLIQTHRINVMPFRFDVARTTALALVPPDVDICVSLDLDERLEPGWRQAIERCIRAGQDMKQPVTRIWARYHTEGLQPFLHDSRVHSRFGYRWDHPCHECIVPYGIDEHQVASDSLQIMHHPDKSKVRTHYLDLLGIGIDEGHKAAGAGLRRRIFYYARELIIFRHYKNAANWLERYMANWRASGEEKWGEVEQADAMLTLARGALLETEERGAAAAPKLPTRQDVVEDGEFRDSLARQGAADALRKVALGEVPAIAFVDTDSLAKR